MTALQTDPAPLIAVKGASKAFGRNAVLKNVSFSLNAGEVLARMAPANRR